MWNKNFTHLTILYVHSCFFTISTLAKGALIETSSTTSLPKGKILLEQVSDAIKVKHYSPRTEETHIYWIRQYILFHDKRHPKERAQHGTFSAPKGAYIDTLTEP